MRSYREDNTFKTPGEMGLRDVRIVERIYESAAKGGVSIPLGGGKGGGGNHLCDCDDVTHAVLIAAAREYTLTKIAACQGPVLLLHDATELDYTSLASPEGACSAQRLPELGRFTMNVQAQPGRQSRTNAEFIIRGGPLQVCPPHARHGHHGNDPLPLCGVQVAEGRAGHRSCSACR